MDERPLHVFWGGEVQEGNPFCSQKGFPSWESSSSPASLAVHTLTASGEAVRVARALGGVLYAPGRIAGELGAEAFAGSFGEHVAGMWGRCRGHVFFAACGAVVRVIAPLVKDKAVDPAVVVADPAGRFVVSVLSGHLGGANDLARVVAAVTGGQAVITTATDAVGAPAVEVLAARLGMSLENRAALAGVNAALAEGRRVAVFDPGNRFAVGEGQERFFEWVAGLGEIGRGAPHVVVDVRELVVGDRGLVLRPRVLAVGVGCRKGVDGEVVLAAVRAVLGEKRLAAGSVGVLATAEIKRGEPGIGFAARRLGVEVGYYPEEALDAVAVPTPSGTVKKRVGTKSVCEAAAMLAAGTDRLVVKKTVNGPVTVAVAMAAAAG